MQVQSVSRVQFNQAGDVAKQTGRSKRRKGVESIQKEVIITTESILNKEGRKGIHRGGMVKNAWDQWTMVPAADKKWLLPVILGGRKSDIVITLTHSEPETQDVNGLV